MCSHEAGSPGRTCLSAVWPTPRRLRARATAHAMRDLEMSALKQWIYSKWRPGNAELFIVGKIDPAEAEASVRTYFEGWSYKGDGEPIGMSEMPRPTVLPERQVLIFGKPIATQSQITMACQVRVEDELRDRAKAAVVGDVLSEMAWGATVKIPP